MTWTELTKKYCIMTDKGMLIPVRKDLKKYEDELKILNGKSEQEIRETLQKLKKGE